MTDYEMYLICPVKSVASIPNVEHWAVLVQKTDSFFIPGDERSRTNPGHGYPERTETVEQLQYFPFSSPDDAKQYIRYLVSKAHGPVKMEHICLIHVTQTARVEASVNISIVVA